MYFKQGRYQKFCLRPSPVFISYLDAPVPSHAHKTETFAPLQLFDSLQSQTGLQLTTDVAADVGFIRRV